MKRALLKPTPSHIIYHIPGRKVGCTRNFEQRKRDYKSTEAVMPEMVILRELYEATDQEAGDIEQMYNQQYGYKGQRQHYTQSRRMPNYMTVPLRLDKDMVDEIDRLRVKLSWHPNRTQCLRWMIEKNMKLLEKAAEADNQEH